MADVQAIPVPANIQDRTGHKKNFLTVIGYAGRRGKQSRHHWWCRCRCGGITVQDWCNLNEKGRLVSCGCHRRAVLLANGAKRTAAMFRPPEWRSWKGMIARCIYPNNPRFKDYGGRGITVCQRWINSIHDFLADVGAMPGPGYQLDRIDNNGHYEPGNVRWVTRKENARNKRNNVNLTLEGRTMCVAQWAEELGVSPQLLHARIRCGWPDAKVLTCPIRQRNR